MNVTEMIEKLKTLPPNAQVYLVDVRKNLHHSADEGSGEGIYTDLYVNSYTEEDVAEGTAPFVGIEFTNEDYSDDGRRIVP